MTIPLFFGRYPRIDLTLPTIEVGLYNIDTASGIQTEPVYERVNRYHVIIRFATVERIVNGNYEIRISRESQVFARQPITIQVTGQTFHFASCQY